MNKPTEKRATTGAENCSEPDARFLGRALFNCWALCATYNGTKLMKILPGKKHKVFFATHAVGKTESMLCELREIELISDQEISFVYEGMPTQEPRLLLQQHCRDND